MKRKSEKEGKEGDCYRLLRRDPPQGSACARPGGSRVHDSVTAEGVVWTRSGVQGGVRLVESAANDALPDERPGRALGRPFDWSWRRFKRKPSKQHPFNDTPPRGRSGARAAWWTASDSQAGQKETHCEICHGFCQSGEGRSWHCLGRSGRPKRGGLRYLPPIQRISPFLAPP
jgi:hypothetical protein